jgi:hypothetical protein
MNERTMRISRLPQAFWPEMKTGRKSVQVAHLVSHQLDMILHRQRTDRGVGHVAGRSIVDWHARTDPAGGCRARA